MKPDPITFRDEDDARRNVRSGPLGASFLERVPHLMDAAALPRASVARPAAAGATPVDLDDVNNARTLAVLSVPPHSSVLVVGSDSDAVACALRSRGCHVWAIDRDCAATQLAGPWDHGILPGDVETADLDALLGSQRADAILFLDVLEHLRDPAAAIRRAVPLLAPGGKMVLSVPHVAHAATRLQLLAGAFPRSSEGLLDRTHLHFFDRSSLDELLRHAGVRVIDEARVVRSQDEIAIPELLAVFPREAIDLAMTGPDADTSQFVVTVTPGAAGTSPEPMPTLAGTLTERLHRVERSYRRLQQQVGDLDSQMERHRCEADRLREALDEAREGHRRSADALALVNDDLRRSDLQRRQAEEQLARTTDELVRCQLERRFLRDDVLVKDSYLATLRQQAIQLQQSHAEIQAQHQQSHAEIQAQRQQSRAEIRVLTERLGDLTAMHAAEVRRADDLASSNIEIRQELERARQELHRVHASVADTLAQPRYVVADRCNSWARKASFLHPALKHFWAAWHRGR